MLHTHTTRQFLRHLICCFILVIASGMLRAQQADSTAFDALKDTMPKGVSVSPPTLRFNLNPGTAQSKSIKITNDTELERTFQIKTQDYMADDINRAAETSQVPDDYKYGLKKWLYVTPSLITLKPGEKANINVLLDVPQGDEHAHAGWSIIIIEEVKERKELSTTNTGKEAMGMGIVPTMGFGVFVYQNPPNIQNDKIELAGFSIDNTKAHINMRASNKGDGIGFCIYYVELLNLATGETIKVPAQSATLLPGASREFSIDLPKLPAGSYNALGVLDYGSKEYVETAEMDFTVQ